MVNYRVLGKDSQIICQNIAPKDTGNLAFNSIKLRLLTNGFQIVYVIDIADYLVIQNVKGINKGYIERSRQAVTGYATKFINGHNVGVNSSRKRISQYAKGNPKRMQVMMSSLSRTINESNEQFYKRFNLGGI